MNRKFVIRMLNGLGIMIVLIVMAIMIPLTVPKLFGYEIYGILSNSMEPEIMTGSIVYVEQVNADEIQVNDVITYKMNSDSDVVATHRVVSIENDAFITKGDHNKSVDAQPVGFNRLLGRVVLSIPFFGSLSLFTQSSVGLACIIIGFSFAIFCWIFADYLKNKRVS